MINKELKRLSRRELVDIIYQLKKNEQEMQEEIEALKTELQDKRIRISTAGSIADAAVSVTNIFSAAQLTADIYLGEIDCMKREIACMKENTEKECAQKIKATEKRVKDVFAAGTEKFEILRKQYKNDYEKWQRLQDEIAVLELKKQQLYEGIENG